MEASLHFHSRMVLQATSQSTKRKLNKTQILLNFLLFHSLIFKTEIYNLTIRKNEE